MKKFLAVLLIVGFGFQNRSFGQVDTENNVETEAVLWQCDARDQLQAKFWGHETFSRIGAEDSAIETCQGNSNSPDSCSLSHCLFDWQCNSKACRQ